jgi:YbgC/YbaW family acyl-CoA thioester hydrolase
MIYNQAIIKKHFNELDGSGCSLHTFIPHYIEEYKYELVKKLGLNYRKFKESGGELFVASLEIDFNYPVKSSEELIIKINFLNIRGSRIQIMSKLYNTNGSLVATAISTVIVRNNEGLNLNDYFKRIDEEIEEYVTV